MRIPAFLALLLAVGCKQAPDVPEPGALQAGFARARLPAPVGIGTVGYGGFGVPSAGSPFADLYPATERIHGHPEVKVVVVSRGEGFELVFVRTDTVGVFQQLRRGLVLELEERLGRNLDDALVIGGTHTHSGPGRVIDGGGPYDLIADRFFPEFYERLTDALADTIEAAYADLGPARVGHAMGASHAGHNDRRCEDGEDYENPSIPLLGIEREGELRALVMAYAVHGTVLNIDELTLSQDVSGAIEQGLEDRLDHPVEVVMFNSWGADMAPGDPDVAQREGAEQPDGYDRMERVGAKVAEDLLGTLDTIAWTDAPEITSSTHRFALGRAEIGYAPGEFPYDYGGVYCGSTREADCDAATAFDDLDQSCIPFPAEFPAPEQTEMTAGRVGDLWFVTFPGEPGTRLAESVLADVQAAGAGDVMFLGYTQDYTGYSILEHDWWQGGYEASGAMWGPRQGEYLRGAAVHTFARAFGAPAEVDEPDPVAPFEVGAYTPYAPIPAVAPGTIAADVAPTYGPTDDVVFAVLGGDPWLGTPTAWLETADGQPVLRPNGVPVDSDDLSFWLELGVEPAYKVDATERAFTWAFHLPARKRVPGGVELSGGSWRIRVEVPGSGEVVSAPFSVE